jgi:hypothetical protein
MRDRRQNTNSQFTRDICRVTRQTPLHRQESFTTKGNRLLQQQPVLGAQISEPRLSQPGGPRDAFFGRALHRETDRRVMGDVPDPAQMAWITER